MRSAPKSDSFLSNNLDLHRQHTNTRDEQIRAVATLIHNDALDLLEMLFTPLTDVERWSTGRRK